jgi:hypothetical protein
MPRFIRAVTSAAVSESGLYVSYGPKRAAESAGYTVPA